MYFCFKRERAKTPDYLTKPLHLDNLPRFILRARNAP